MECEYRCLNKRACELLGCCLYNHRLLVDKHHLLKNVTHISTGKVLKILTDIEPPKSELAQMKRKTVQNAIFKAKNIERRANKPKKEKMEFIRYQGVLCLLYGYIIKPVSTTTPLGSMVFYYLKEDILVVKVDKMFTPYYFETLIDYVAVSKEQQAKRRRLAEKGINKYLID